MRKTMSRKCSTRLRILYSNQISIIRVILYQAETRRSDCFESKNRSQVTYSLPFLKPMLVYTIDTLLFLLGRGVE